MKKKVTPIIIYRLILVLIITAMMQVPAIADGTDTYADALAVLDIAIANEDITALQSLVNDDIGLSVAGQEIPNDLIEDMLHDTSLREFRIFTDEGVATVEMSFEELLWGEDGAFTVMNEVTLSHYMVIDREELHSENTLGLWEHGELETAVVLDEDDVAGVYIFPDLFCKVIFIKLDGYWYLSAINLRIE